jgi:hypothetical protein
MLKIIAMLNVTEARSLVQSYINSIYHVDGDELVILDEETIVKPYGWVFLYESRKFLETNNITFAALGNAPIIVEKENGTMTVLGTAEPLEYYIEKYESQRGI